jgi:hypothetical protein
MMLSKQCSKYVIPSNRSTGLLRSFGQQTLYNTVGIVRDLAIWIGDGNFREIIFSQGTTAIGTVWISLEVAVRAIFFRFYYNIECVHHDNFVRWMGYDEY